MKLIDISLNSKRLLTEDEANRMEKKVGDLIEVFYVPERDALRVTSVNVALKHDTTIPATFGDSTGEKIPSESLSYNKLSPSLVRRMDEIASTDKSDSVKLTRIFALFDETHAINGPIYMFDNLQPLRASDLLAVARQCIEQNSDHDEMVLDQFSGSYNGVSMGNGNFVYLYDYEGRVRNHEEDQKTANSFWERFCKEKGTSEHTDTILHVRYGLGSNPVRSGDRFQHYIVAQNRTVDAAFVPVLKK